jgi:hypothetical protein
MFLAFALIRLRLSQLGQYQPFLFAGNAFCGPLSCLRSRVAVIGCDAAIGLGLPLSRMLTSQTSTPTYHSRTLSLIFLLFVSLAFALYQSNSAFTSDEVWSVKAASLDYNAEMALLKADVHPPLYYQMLYVWVRLFGTGERAVRSLSGLFYILSVFAVYGVGKSLYENRTALLCATIYASSPLAILSAQFARMYALLSLVSILSTWLYLQFSLKPHDSRLRFALYIVVNIFGSFTHIGFFFVLFAQIVFHVLFFRRTRLIKFATALIVSLLPYTYLWAPVLMRQMSQSNEGIAWVSKPNLFTIAELILLYGGVLWLLVPILLYLWWRGGFEPLREFSQLRISRFPLWLLAIAIATPLLISLVKPIFNSRLAIIGLHLFALTVGAVIGTKSNHLLAFALVVLTAVGLIAFHPPDTTCDNRSMAVYLSRTANDGDAVIFTSLTRLPIDYYLQQAPTKKLFETSFPAEIDQHPGYEGRITDPNRRPALERESRELVERIATTSAGKRIFFFRGAHPEIDRILEKALLERFEVVTGEGLKCELSPYFKEVSLYRLAER